MLQCFANKILHGYIKQFHHDSFLFKIMKIPIQKGRALMQMYRVVPQTMQMYRVVPQTKRGNCIA